MNFFLKNLKPVGIIASTVFALAFQSEALAITVIIDGGVAIVDGGAMDLDGVVNGVVSFDSTAAGPAGFATASGYQVRGSALIGLAGGAGAALRTLLPPGGPIFGVTLTNLEVDAVAGAILGAPLAIQFGHTFFPGAPAGGALIVAGDLLDDAFGDNGTGAPTFGFNPLTAVPLVLGVDSITLWQGEVNGAAIPGPFPGVAIAGCGGPFLPPGPPVPNCPGLGVGYPDGFGHLAPAFIGPGPFDLDGNLTLTLGGPRDQFRLNESAVVGITLEGQSMSIPETSSPLGLLALSFLGTVSVVKRKLKP